MIITRSQLVSLIRESVYGPINERYFGRRKKVDLDDLATSLDEDINSGAEKFSLSLSDAFLLGMEATGLSITGNVSFSKLLGKAAGAMAAIDTGSTVMGTYVAMASAPWIAWMMALAAAGSAGYTVGSLIEKFMRMDVNTFKKQILRRAAQIVMLGKPEWSKISDRGALAYDPMSGPGFAYYTPSPKAIIKLGKEKGVIKSGEGIIKGDRIGSKGDAPGDKTATFKKKLVLLHLISQNMDEDEKPDRGYVRLYDKMVKDGIIDGASIGEEAKKLNLLVTRDLAKKIKQKKERSESAADAVRPARGKKEPDTPPGETRLPLQREDIRRLIRLLSR